MSCATPANTATLADYWLAALPHSQEEELELHLLQCDPCGDRLREVIALAEALRRIAAEASLRMIVSDAFLERASADGLRVRQYAPPPGGAVQCTVAAEDDILIARLAADLSGAQRVDLSLCDEHGTQQHRLHDIPVHSRTTSVIFQESITFAKAAPDSIMIARLIAFDQSGAERVLGEYTFNHTRSLPGPGQPYNPHPE
jgi:hypothetical protein